jgi:anti-sigma factor RsiW
VNGRHVLGDEGLAEEMAREAAVLNLALVASFTQAEIAEVLVLPVGTVMSRTLNGMRAVRTGVGKRGFEPPEGQADLAHPQAADWVLGTLKAAEDADFGRHLTGCAHCRAAVAEFGELAQVLQHLPLPVAAPGTEPLTIAGLLAAAAEGEAATQVHRTPEAYPQAAEPESAHASRIRLGPPEAGHGERPAGAGAQISRFPRWLGHLGLIAIAGAVAAAIIALIVYAIGGSDPAAAVTFKLGSPSGRAASGVATERLDASGAWNVSLSVQYLTNLGNAGFYECWYVGPGRPGHRLLFSAGTFVVLGDDGSGTFSMTSAVDPHQFRTMEITAETPGFDGAQHGTVVLTGQPEL